ncbi:glycoside hydrolase family 15 protein [Candidatus Poribacteria bacterium]
MPRDLPIGNGSLLVNFDQNYAFRDVYYPHVGGSNHSLGHPSLFGVWTEGQFSWVKSAEWSKSLEYHDETLVTHVTAINLNLKVKLTINDTVDCLRNIYLKKITVEDLAGRDREIRIFISRDLHILEARLGDTAYYDPRTSSIIHYKKTCYFLMSCLHSGGSRIDQYAVGAQDSREAEGTWHDAEDGTLSGNPAANGNVDSTIAIHLNVPARGQEVAYYWMAAGRKYGEVTELNKLVLDEGPDYLMDRTASYWKAWLSKGLRNSGRVIEADGVLPEEVLSLYKKSLLILRTQIDNEGAIIAANELHVEGTDDYSYMWPRDGAMVAYALDEAGYAELTRRFFEFCANVITSEGFFLHKYNPDRSAGSSWLPWIADGQLQLPIQEDETALVVWAFWRHFQKHQNIEFVRTLYEPLVTRTGDFMLRYRDKSTGLPLPSYDIWEERHGIHTFTTTAVCAGLTAAANFAEIFGDQEKASQYRAASEKVKAAMETYLYSKEQRRFLRTIVPSGGEYQLDLTVDSSMYATFAFGVYDVFDKKVERTMKVIMEKLSVKTSVSGIARYAGDHYNRVSEDFQNVPGNPWIICTLWTAQYAIAKAKTISELQDAIPILQWATEHAMKSGVLPEQLHPHTGQSLSVSPLTWSHGEFILTIRRFIEKFISFRGKSHP